MKGFAFTPAVIPEGGSGYGAPSCRTAGPARGVLLPVGEFALWALRGRLGAGARLIWAGNHPDEALYVLKGELRVGDRVCPEGGAVVVESGVSAELVASSDAEVVHFGPRDEGPPASGILGPPDPDGHEVHVIGPGAMYAAPEPGRDTRLFADSTCCRCRLFLLLTGRDGEYVSSRHSHSADEIIYVLRGELHFGRHSVGPGQAVAIGSGRRYAFRSGPAGFAFLNYRAEPSQQTIAGGKPRFEGGRARGLVLTADFR